jgi:glycosyltransferase involved in cell wall biosynthesis
MKIVFLNKYQFKVARGAETFVSELAKRLSETHEIRIVAKINYIDLLKSDFDVIIPTNGRFQVFITRIISWIKGAKMIVSGQSGAGLDDRLNLYAFPDVFVGLTSHQSSWAKRINPFVRVVTIPNGVDLDLFRESSHKGSKIILSVGAFTKEKRHELTIKAVAKIKNVKLKIVGSGGDEKDSIHKMGEKILGKRFEMLSVSHEKMPEVYKEASVLAFPTVKWESFGIVLVEAMASGLPVVATDDQIRREIVGDAGILVDPTKTDIYSKALKSALAKNWGNIPRKRAENFSWDGIARAYEGIINRSHNDEN